MRILRPEPDGPERHDLPATVLFIPYGPERRANISGLFIDHSCSFENCRNRPIFLLETNVEVHGACEDHIAQVLGRAIARVQRFGGDEDAQPGFLHTYPIARCPHIPLVPYDTDQMIFSDTLDERYAVEVYRAVKDSSYGVLVVSDRVDHHIYLRRTVPLIEDAAYGPDMEDAQSWRQVAIEAIDDAKTTAQKLREALSRADLHRKSNLRLLRTSDRAQHVFESACRVFASPDAALSWLWLPNLALGGKSPLDTLHNPASTEQILDLINSIESWDLRMISRSRVLRPDES